MPGLTPRPTSTSGHPAWEPERLDWGSLAETLSCLLASRPAGKVPGSREGKGRDPGSDTGGERPRGAVPGVGWGTALAAAQGGASRADPSTARRALAEAPSPPGAQSSGQAEEGESALPGTSSRDAPPPQPPAPSTFRSAASSCAASAGG